MEAKINVVELASVLAHRELIKQYGDTVKIYEDEEAAMTNYTDEAQEIFDMLYDEYYDIITNPEIQE